MRKSGTVIAMILAALKHRPMTRKEVCEFTGMHHNSIATVMTRMATATSKRPQRIYIAKYIHELDGMKRYPRAVYAIGEKLNATKPKPDVIANKRRYLQRKQRKLRCTSVFNLALTQKQAIAMTRGVAA